MEQSPILIIPDCHVNTLSKHKLHLKAIEKTILHLATKFDNEYNNYTLFFLGDMFDAYPLNTPIPNDYLKIIELLDHFKNSKQIYILKGNHDTNLSDTQQALNVIEKTNTKIKIITTQEIITINNIKTLCIPYTKNPKIEDNNYEVALCHLTHPDTTYPDLTTLKITNDKPHIFGHIHKTHIKPPIYSLGCLLPQNKQNTNTNYYLKLQKKKETLQIDQFEIPKYLEYKHLDIIDKKLLENTIIKIQIVPQNETNINIYDNLSEENKLKIQFEIIKENEQMDTKQQNIYNILHTNFNYNEVLKNYKDQNNIPEHIYKLLLDI